MISGTAQNLMSTVTSPRRYLNRFPVLFHLYTCEQCRTHQHRCTLQGSMTHRCYDNRTVRYYHYDSESHRHSCYPDYGGSWICNFEHNSNNDYPGGFTSVGLYAANVDDEPQDWSGYRGDDSLGSRHTVQYSVRTNDCVLTCKLNFPAVVEAVIGACFAPAKSKIAVDSTEPMITDLKNRYVLDYHHAYSNIQFVFFTVGGSFGCSWGHTSAITTQGVFTILDNQSTLYPSWGDVGSLRCSSLGVDNRKSRTFLRRTKHFPIRRVVCIFIRSSRKCRIGWFPGH